MTKLQKNVPIIEFTHNVILEILAFKDILVKKFPALRTGIFHQSWYIVRIAVIEVSMIEDLLYKLSNFGRDIYYQKAHNDLKYEKSHIVKKPQIFD